ncbi:MAG: sulfatase-like hydrolase/transferase, partial [Actinomycetota bacterium]|nr:sulfatase-like hydrolase/transferase [Actinomycetota bacterium]
DAGVRQLTRLKALWSDLKYVEGRLILPPGLADRLPDVGTNFEGFGDTDDAGGGGIDEFFVKGRGNSSEPEEYRQFIRQIPKSDRGLTMMHLHLPHQPWRYDRTGRQYNSSPIEQLSRSTAEWLVDDNGITSAQARMYTQTGFADELIGELKRDLVKKGLWDEAIVVVTADHGISFEGGEVPQRMVDERAMGEVANPPLFIKYPGQKKGEVSDKHSMTIDIVPTIAEAVGVEDPYEFDGVPLQGPVPDRPIAVKDIKNRETKVELPEMIAQRNAAIARADERMGTGPIYTLGPAPGLIGKPAPPVPAGTTSAALDSPGLWDDYRPRRKIVPMNVTGVIESGTGGDLTIAVGVNGRIEGTARPFEFEGATRFGTLINPDALRPGRNEITIYAADGDKLTPLGSN